MLPLGVPVAAAVGVSGEQEMRFGRPRIERERLVVVRVGLIGVLGEQPERHLIDGACRMLPGPLLVLPFQARQAFGLRVLQLLTLGDLDQPLVCVDEFCIRRNGLAERGDGFVQLSGFRRRLTRVERRSGGRRAHAVAGGQAGGPMPPRSEPASRPRASAFGSAYAYGRRSEVDAGWKCFSAAPCGWHRPAARFRR